MKNLLTLILCILIFTGNMSGQCPPAGVTITSQADLDYFETNYPDCEIIDGDVQITSSDVTNLNAFNKVSQIKGSLTINNNDALTDLSGLASLTQINDYVRIQNNVALLSLNGLQNLQKINGDFFYLENSPLVTDLSGLSGLDSIDGIFQIWAMDGINDLEGLQNLKYINGTFAVFLNASLTSFEGLNSLATITDALRIYENPELTSIMDLPIDLQIYQSLVVNDNPLLASCSAEAICNYLADPPSFFVFNINSEGCNSPEQVIAGCETNSSKVSIIRDLKASPNPGNGIIEIENLFQGVSKIEVIDQYGRIKELIPSRQLDLSHLPAGVYIIRAVMNGMIYQTRYVKL